MILIALSGGSSAERVSISDLLVKSGKGALLAYSQPTPGADYNLRRVATLRDVLDAPEGDAPSSPAAGLVITHCLTDEEAQEVRQRGGAVWHLYRKPSNTVVNLRGDTMVALDGSGPAHVLDPMEALSELMLKQLKQLASPGAALTRAALARLAARE